MSRKDELLAALEQLTHRELVSRCFEQEAEIDALQQQRDILRRQVKESQEQVAWIRQEIRK